MNRVKLFCLPYAGGSAMTYCSWRKWVPSWLEVIPIEMAGRGNRLNVPFYESLAGDGTDDLFGQIVRQLDDRPFAIFGHSLGALFAYEVSLRIVSETDRTPAHVFFSGSAAPHVPREHQNVHLLPDKQFQEQILQLGGTIAEVFDNKSFANVFTPILRADYRLAETYEPLVSRGMLGCDITVLHGAEDRYPRSDAEEWKHYTKAECHVNEFQGKHFFIHDYKQQIVDLVSRRVVEPIDKKGA